MYAKEVHVFSCFFCPPTVLHFLCPFFLLQFLFKKYLQYESSLGDEERIESVKRKAMDYVETTLA